MKQNRKFRKNSETNNWFFGEINKRDKTNLIDQKKKKTKRWGEEAITTNLIEIKGLLENTMDNCCQLIRSLT